MIDSTSSIPAAASGATPANTPASASGTTSSIASDFETFLKMLTAQARYQDPLEPIDSTEYAAQLAQFSMVEQQVQTNDTLSALTGQMGMSGMASLAGWVGMEARAVAPVYFDGTPITVQPSPAKTADQAYLVVKDTAGSEVHRVQILTASDSFEWTGIDASGEPVANGVYEFTVESFANGEVIESGATEVYGLITEAQISGNETVLIMRGGQAVPASSVTALRGGE